jgi:DNA polymerase III subunit epsilon
VLASWVHDEWLAFDLETTGVDVQTDVPVSFALVDMRDGEVISSRYSLVDPGREIPPGASEVHGISTERAQAEGIPLDVAIEEIASALADASARSVPVVGFNLAYDLTMIDACCRRLDGCGLVERGWSGPVLDPIVMDKHLDRYRKGGRTLGVLCEAFGVTNEAAHDARGDAIAAALLLRAYAERFDEIGGTELDELYRSQMTWHRTWAGGFSDYLLRNGRSGLGDEEFEWPIHRPPALTLF